MRGVREDFILEEEKKNTLTNVCRLFKDENENQSSIRATYTRSFTSDPL